MTKPTNVVLELFSFMFRYTYTLENLIKNLGIPDKQQTNQIILEKGVSLLLVVITFFYLHGPQAYSQPCLLTYQMSIK